MNSTRPRVVSVTPRIKDKECYSCSCSLLHFAIFFFHLCRFRAPTYPLKTPRRRRERSERGAAVRALLPAIALCEPVWNFHDSPFTSTSSLFVASSRRHRDTQVLLYARVYTFGAVSLFYYSTGCAPVPFNYPFWWDLVATNAELWCE